MTSTAIQQSHSAGSIKTGRYSGGGPISEKGTDMELKLEQLAEKLDGISHPEDFFGAENTVLPRSYIEEHYIIPQFMKSAEAASPDSYTGFADRELAADLLRRLHALREEAYERIENKAYGMSRRETILPHDAREFFSASGLKFFRSRKLEESDRMTRFEGFVQRNGVYVGDAVIKVAADSRHNGLLDNESRIIAHFHRQENVLWRHLPCVLARFTAGERSGLVVRSFDGYTLEAVRRREAYRTGVDPRDALWMLSRTLGGLGFVHANGVIHGNIHPRTLFIQHQTHNAILLDWEHAVLRPGVTGERIAEFPALFTAPEVIAGKCPGPWSDLYSVGKTWIWLLGGDPETNEFPQKLTGKAEVPAKLRRFLLDLVREAPSQRPQDTWAVYDTFEALKRQLWEPKWRVFSMQ